MDVTWMERILNIFSRSNMDIWGFPYMGDPLSGWLMENPSMDDCFGRHSSVPDCPIQWLFRSYSINNIPSSVRYIQGYYSIIHKP